MILIKYSKTPPVLDKLRILFTTNEKEREMEELIYKEKDEDLWGKEFSGCVCVCGYCWAITNYLCVVYTMYHYVYNEVGKGCKNINKIYIEQKTNSSDRHKHSKRSQKNQTLDDAHRLSAC